MDAKTGLKKMKTHSPDKLILGYININLIRNKFVSATYVLDKNDDIFLISKTKMDDSFHSGKFKTKVFTTLHRYDRNKKRRWPSIVY